MVEEDGATRSSASSSLVLTQSRIAEELLTIVGDHLKEQDIPFLEDVLNDPVIQSFNAWRSEKGDDPLSSAPPSYAVNKDKKVAHAAAGRQAGVGSSELAFAPLIEEANDKLRHLEAAIE